MDAADLDVLGAFAQLLHGLRQFKRNFGLARADENQHLERVAGEEFQIFRADVFKIDQHVVGGQEGLLGSQNDVR